jgi:hypothetical protein
MTAAWRHRRLRPVWRRVRGNSALPRGPANGADPKLHGQGPRAEADAARHLPRLTTSRQERDAGGVTRSGF